MEIKKINKDLETLVQQNLKIMEIHRPHNQQQQQQALVLQIKVKILIIMMKVMQDNKKTNHHQHLQLHKTVMNQLKMKLLVKTSKIHHNQLVKIIMQKVQIQQLQLNKVIMPILLLEMNQVGKLLIMNHLIQEALHLLNKAQTLILENQAIQINQVHLVLQLNHHLQAQIQILDLQSRAKQLVLLLKMLLKEFKVELLPLLQI